MQIRRITPWIVLAAAVALAAVQSRRLAAIRQSGMPEAYPGYTADPPPALTFVMAGLGGFRGIVSEVLWFRAERLQEESRYLELVQLADWLTMLDPHAAEAWVYNAWNLAYNVSVMMIRHEDRLRWVQNGIRLLRDDGIRMNPKEPRLYRELAWMYMNKVGGTLDEAHATYQKTLADRMAPCVDANGKLADSPECRAVLAEHRMDADKMLEIEKRFGPVDWRLPEAHSLYWAWLGLQFPDGGLEELMCRRLIYQSLLLIIITNPSAAHSVADRLKLVPATTDFFTETFEKFPSRTMRSVYLQYLAKIAVLARENEREDIVRECHTRFAKALPAGVKPPTIEEMIQEAKRQ